MFNRSQSFGLEWNRVQYNTNRTTKAYKLLAHFNQIAKCYIKSKIRENVSDYVVLLFFLGQTCFSSVLGYPKNL